VCWSQQTSMVLPRRFKKIICVTITTRLLPLFISFMRALSTQNNVKCVWHCIFTTTSSSLAAPSLLSLANTKARKILSPQTQQASGHFPYQTIKQMSSSNVMAETFRGLFCLQGARAAIIPQTLAESRPNPSTRQILSLH
jgi:hypothetical protein